jgi:hypothetical protein
MTPDLCLSEHLMERANIEASKGFIASLLKQDFCHHLLVLMTQQMTVE